uniref:Uncharacterized protein n=1 Tax=Mycobacterium riyadhense TaxID=486698 RepID=A0A653F1X8_9MYCO|nr:hypothetical protein BIN_B_04820 [Mycobacterium riyadhense]
MPNQATSKQVKHVLDHELDTERNRVAEHTAPAWKAVRLRF